MKHYLLLLTLISGLFFSLSASADNMGNVTNSAVPFGGINPAALNISICNA